MQELELEDFPCYRENGNICRITLLSSQDFPARPLFYHVGRCSVTAINKQKCLAAEMYLRDVTVGKFLVPLRLRPCGLKEKKLFVTIQKLNSSQCV